MAQPSALQSHLLACAISGVLSPSHSTSRLWLLFCQIIFLLAWLADRLGSSGSGAVCWAEGAVHWVAKHCRGCAGPSEVPGSRDCPGLCCRPDHRICYKIVVWLGGPSYCRYRGDKIREGIDPFGHLVYPMFQKECIFWCFPFLNVEYSQTCLSSLGVCSMVLLLLWIWCIRVSYY